MFTVKNNFKMDIEAVVEALSQFDVLELTHFFERLNQRIRVPEPTLTPQQREILLLRQIKAMIPRSVVRRLKALQQKQYVQPLSAPEQREIKSLIEFIEMKSAERVYLIGALAQLRQIPITELAKQLQLKRFHG
jgi:hypothetical protein